MAVEARQKLTYADYAALPDDGQRWEIVDGEAYVTPAPSMRHQDIALRLAVAFFNHIAAHGGGKVYIAPTDVVLSDNDVVEPDVLFIADAVRDRITVPNVQGAPSLAIEVLSNPRHDRVRKRALYARFGVPEYWIVDPDSDRVEVHKLVGGDYPAPQLFEPGTALAYDGLPGLVIDITDLFSE